MKCSRRAYWRVLPVQVHHQHLLLIVARLRDQLADGIEGDALSPERVDGNVRSGNRADVVGREHVGHVLEGPRGEQLPPDRVLGVRDAEGGHDHLGPAEGEATHRLGKIGVVTQRDAHSPLADTEHGVAGSGAEVDRLDAQIGVELSVDHHVPISADVRLAVLADDAALRADQHCGVVAEIRAVALENGRDDVQPVLHRLGLHRGDRRPGVRGGELVAGIVARRGKERGAPVLRQQNDLRALRDGIVDQPLRGGDVAFDFPELAVHLDQGGLHGCDDSFAWPTGGGGWRQRFPSAGGSRAPIVGGRKA